MEQLRILHCLRAPVGGLFRHVRDLATEQARRGHRVGVLYDQTASDSLTEERLARLAPHLDLGLHRAPMARSLGLSDLPAYQRARDLIETLGIDVAHGHGAKGGAYARLAVRTLRQRGADITTFYTPHSGSLHFAPGTMQARIFMSLERQLMAMTDGLIFESGFARARYLQRVGGANIAQRVVFNGVTEGEFAPRVLDADASELLFIGELRQLKGVDVLLRALVEVRETFPARLTIVGEGSEGDAFKALAPELGLGEHVRFTGALPAREAFALGRILVVPSRAESLPYVVLEAAAAGCPLIATDVGGIPEIVKQTNVALVPADDTNRLAARVCELLGDPAMAERQAAQLKARVREQFTVETMTDQILEFYGNAAAALAA